jgi:hypothetical protein
MPGWSYLVDTNILLRLVPRKVDWSRESEWFLP